MKKNSNQRGYTSISTPDGKWRVWINRLNKSGQFAIACGFSIGDKLQFVDAIDALEYVQVEEVCHLDDDLSDLIIDCTIENHGEVFLRLIEDLPELMDKYLVKHPIKSE